MALRRRDRPNDQGESLFDASKIDLVATTPDGATVELIIVNDTPWTGSDAQVRSLQEKIHNYVGYAADGQLIDAFPHLSSLPWRIVIKDLAGPPDLRTQDVITKVAEVVRRHGGDLVLGSAP